MDISPKMIHGSVPIRKCKGDLDGALGAEAGQVPGLAGELAPEAVRHLELRGGGEDGGCRG
jgi:hypothetical protein